MTELRRTVEPSAVHMELLVSLRQGEAIAWRKGCRIASSIVASRNEPAEGETITRISGVRRVILPRHLGWMSSLPSGMIRAMSESDAPWSVGRLLQWTTQWFTERQVEGGRLAAELLLARAMGCRKIELYTRYDQEPPAEQRAAFRDLVRQAGEHKPIAYLLGSREFFSLDFAVSPAVLIPRPETEALVQAAIDLCRTDTGRTWRILDIGTGSGCVAIAIARYAANAEVVASDVSPDALAVARANAEKHGMSGQIRLLEADCARIPLESCPAGGFDLIVSNPPYIPEPVWRELPPGVRDHEPRLALTPPSGDGLEMYRRLAGEVPEIIAPGGRLMAEIGHDQHAAVLEVFASTDRWGYAGSHRNPTDPYDRVVEFVLRA
jgi:release factor glutamine methyltransferase